MPTGVRAGQPTDGIEEAGEQGGVGGMGDDRSEHAVDVEGGEQRPPQRRDLAGDGRRVVERRLRGAHWSAMTL